MQNRTSPLSWGGEFRDSVQEAVYQDERMPEHLRHVRLVLFYAFLFNLLFLYNDWRFVGQPHFVVALGARAGIAAASLGGLLLLRRAHTFRRLQRLCLAWTVPVIVASAVLLSPHTDVALAILFMLPILFYLAMPMSFCRTVAAGMACSVATLLGFLWAEPLSPTRYGVALAMLTINVVLALVLIRMNRLQRLEWAATRAVWAANQELAEQRQMLQTLLRAVPAPLIILALETGRLIQANDAARAYFGPEMLADAKALFRSFGLREPVPLAFGEQRKNDGTVHETEMRLDLGGGVCRNVLLVTTTTQVRGEAAIMAVVVDITARKELEAHLQQLASTDPLTGLANRGSFFALAAEELKRTQRYRRPLAVVMLDIDHFKDINDSFGHEAGDVALRAFAALCRSLLREPDVMGRIGGEEFALLLPETTRESAKVLAERLRAAVAELRLPGLCASMTVSIGISEVLPEETALSQALSRADQALYAAKRAGRNRIAIFT